MASKPQTTRTLGATTFTKAIKPGPVFNNYGVDVSKKWAQERIQNEVTALQFIAANTTIPVPRFLDTGIGENGPYLTVQRVDGIELTNVAKECRHQTVNCTACQAIANQNTTTFIKTIVLPQLAALKSNQSGLNGLVIPPPWVTEEDRRATWPSKMSATAEFEFWHGDLGGHNIMCDRDTLQVICLFDWENAGYYPPEFKLWSVDWPGFDALFTDKNRLAKLIRLLEPY